MPSALEFEILAADAEFEPAVRDFLRPALETVPEAVWRRLGRCRIRLVAGEQDWSSRWTVGPGEVEIELVAVGDAHDLALEALYCLGQMLWETLEPPEWRAWLRVLARELEAGVEGEIDEAALEEKRKLFSSRLLARSRRCLERYAATAFAASFAEYVHALWHDVTVRTGAEHLPAEWLRRRLELLAAWFPPPPGRRLFA